MNFIIAKLKTGAGFPALNSIFNGFSFGYVIAPKVTHGYYKRTFGLTASNLVTPQWVIKNIDEVVINLRNRDLKDRNVCLLLENDFRFKNDDVFEQLVDNATTTVMVYID